MLRDPVLDELERRAVAASPDLRTAALHFAQARVQRGVTAAQAGPQVNGTAGATRQRQSEVGASTRMLDVIGGAAGNRDQLVSLLSEPFNLYQAGFDASWELDLWGRVRHAIEAADADVATQAALLEQARMTLASDVARHYIELRTAQRQQDVLSRDIAAQQERLSLLQARANAGALAELDLARQHGDLEASRAQIPPLLAQQAASIGQIELLLGEHPGALNALLAKAAPEADVADVADVAALPALALGLPSEVAQRRPDIQAAEAKLRAATANIGVAKADLYPSIKLGGHFGFESTADSKFGSWGSRTWTVGPSLDLPIFDHGRRLRVVQLRELQQQEAAVAYQRTVMAAWHEIDDALNGYAAESEQLSSLKARDLNNRESLKLALARYEGGTVDYTAVLDGQRGVLQSQRDVTASEGRLLQRFAALNKAIAAPPKGEAARTSP
jgi:NodT family efflux transporter outer membrane factor (OMF) lipoprotein